MNPAVQEAIRPDLAGWDLVIFDEAHRLTPTATSFHQVGRLLAKNTPASASNDRDAASRQGVAVQASVAPG